MALRLERRVERFTFDLPVEVATARGTWERRREGVILTLTDEAGRVGRGEASPLPGYGADTLDAVEAELRAGAPRSPAARCAWETAEVALAAAARGVSFEEALAEGGARRDVVEESALVASVAEARAALARAGTDTGAPETLATAMR